MPSSPNPVLSTSAVTPDSESLEERMTPSDFRMGQASVILIFLFALVLAFSMGIMRLRAKFEA